MYTSSFEEKLMKIDIPKDKYSNLTSTERQALFDLKKNNMNIAVKGAVRGLQ